MLLVPSVSNDGAKSHDKTGMPHSEASLKVDKRLPPPPSLHLIDTADVKVDSNFTMFIVQHT